MLSAYVLVRNTIKILRLTVFGESQLSANHTSISSIPEVITHSTPCVVQANLNTALGRIGSRSCQSDCMLHTASCVQILD